MIFTTTKKKVEEPEKYEDDAVLTQFAVKGTENGATKAYSKFSLNKKAMEGFGFEMNKPNVNKIANGFDENNNIILAGTDTGDIYTSIITAKNEFSNGKLLSRLEKQFEIDTTEENEFLLLFDETDGVKMALLCLITESEKSDDTIIPVDEETAQAVAQIKSESIMEPSVSVSEILESDFNEIKSVTDTKEEVFMSQKPVVNPVINGEDNIAGEW